MRIFSAIAVFLLLSSSIVNAQPKKTIRIAVGPDHVTMLENKYPFYAASWHFIHQMLAQQNINVEAYSMPWARAKTKVLDSELDGLFLAANFKGRDHWATLSLPLGYDYFGHFAKPSTALPQEVIGMVRLGKHDQIHQDVADVKTIEVATAQIGLTLLAEDKLSKFVMSQGYGNYLLNNELKQYAQNIFFLKKNAERRSLHIAMSKTHPELQQISTSINQAIEAGIAQGTYKKIMEQFNVPCTTQLACIN